MTDPPPLHPNPASITTDPEEVDLSTHPSAQHGRQQEQRRPASDAELRALLRAGAPPPGIDHESGQGGQTDDPMVKMLSQLMGGMTPGADGSAPPDGNGLPPGLAAMMGVGAGAPGSTQPEGGTYDYVWKILHASFAFALGVYVTGTSTAFAGPVVRIPGKLADESVVAGRNRVNLFWAFATAELILQSARYFLERGRTGSGIGGWMGMASGLLGEPWGSYVRLLARYSGIWSTIVEDGCMLIFIVGVVSWWNGAIN